MNRIPLIVYLDDKEHVTVPQHGGDLPVHEFIAIELEKRKMKPGRLGKIVTIDHSRTYTVMKGKAHSIAVSIILLHGLGFDPKFVTEASL